MSEALKQVEMSMDFAKGLIAKKESFDRLIQNKDFQSLIENDYFLVEASRLVGSRADPSMQDETQQKQLLGRMDGIGYLRQYLSCVNMQGTQAMVDMAAHQETREELLSEDLD